MPTLPGPKVNCNYSRQLGFRLFEKAKETLFVRKMIWTLANKGRARLWFSRAFYSFPDSHKISWQRNPNPNIWLESESSLPSVFLVFLYHVHFDRNKHLMQSMIIIINFRFLKFETWPVVSNGRLDPTCYRTDPNSRTQWKFTSINLCFQVRLFVAKTLLEIKISFVLLTW